MKNKASSVLAILCITGIIFGCAKDQEEEKPFEPTPLVIEKTDITDTEAFKREVSKEVQNIFNKDITITVYADGVEDFCYRGKAELINDGSDGTEPILIIYADSKTMMDSVF